MSIKSFPTLAIISVTSGRLLTRPNSEGNGIEQIYELLGWMTDDTPFTHQLPRFADECKPWLLRWYPELAGLQEEIDACCDAGEVEALANDLDNRFGKMLAVSKLSKDAHETKHPLEELIDLMS